MGKSAELTSLFYQDPRRPLPRRLSPFALSCAMHYVGIAFISYALLHVPPIVERPLHTHYSLRHLDLHVPKSSLADNHPSLYPRAKQPPVKQVAVAPVKPVNPPDDGGEKATASDSRPRPLPAVKIASGNGEGKQTLVQPNLHTHLAMAVKTPMPTVMIWTPAKTPVPVIVPPLPDPPTITDPAASIDIPNEELQMAGLSVTAADTTPRVPMPPPGTTTPVTVKGQELVKMAPATVSDSNNQPTPAAILSVSDMKMNDGRVVLPPVNETLGNGKKGGSGSEQPNGSAESSKILAAGSGGTGEGTPGNAQGGDGGEGAASSAAQTVDHIQLPKDGKFGVIVVGSSLEEQYPEIMQIWSDRVAYTAYLHVGLPRSWILQYAQLRSTDAANSGNVVHIDAPWPYDIFRPNLLASDVNADALMVHGILDEKGRLESLNVAFPGDYPRAAFVIAALKRWQFRPALQQGKATPVEVLLIIPEEVD